MTIQQCKYVLEIAKIGSFSEAAKQLFYCTIIPFNQHQNLGAGVGYQDF